jgi:hypothetical protein
LSLLNLNRIFRSGLAEEIPLNVSSTRAGFFARTSHSPETESEYIPQKVAARDCLFLFGISLIADLSYVNRLGFYIDDWFVWAAFSKSHDQSIVGLLRTWGEGSLLKGIGVRPASALYEAFTFSSFGLHPLPYHVCNTLVLASVAILFYASLRELRLPHCITLMVPLVYEFLPHYATDRFWIACHQAVLSQALFFLGLYCALKAVRGYPSWSLFLKAASILSFGLALLFYEVIVSIHRQSRWLYGCWPLKGA